MNLQERLFALQDPGYRTFHSRLIPTVDPGTVIGVRVPDLRKLAKELSKSSDREPFFRQLPHRYYEENCLHGFLIEMIRDFDSCIAELERFLPYVDNWATCDLMSPKILGSDPVRLLPVLQRWILSDHPYTIRFGLLCLMRHFLDQAFRADYLDWVASLRSEEYYVNMMIAWFFAEALVKQYDAALPVLLEHRLSVWTHNKAIQKARESFRISPEQKAYLNTLKRKA